MRSQISGIFDLGSNIWEHVQSCVVRFKMSNCEPDLSMGISMGIPMGRPMGIPKGIPMGIPLLSMHAHILIARRDIGLRSHQTPHAQRRSRGALSRP